MWRQNEILIVNGPLALYYYYDENVCGFLHDENSSVRAWLMVFEPWGSYLSVCVCVCVCDVRSLSLSCRFLGGNDPRRAKRPPLSDKESPCGDVEKSHHNITLTAREISIVTSPGLTVFLLVIPPPPGLMIKNYSYKYIFSPIPVQIHQIISIIK